MYQRINPSPSLSILSISNCSTPNPSISSMVKSSITVEPSRYPHLRKPVICPRASRLKNVISAPLSEYPSDIS